MNRVYLTLYQLNISKTLTLLNTKKRLPTKNIGKRIFYIFKKSVSLNLSIFSMILSFFIFEYILSDETKLFFFLFKGKSLLTDNWNLQPSETLESFIKKNLCSNNIKDFKLTDCTYMTNQNNEKQENSRRLRSKSGALRRISLQIRKVEIARLEEKQK